MSPLSDNEKEMVIRWAENQAEETEVSDRDFAFHLLASCKVPGGRILAILEKNRTFSRSALEHIQQIFGENDPIGRLNGYLAKVAEELLKSNEIRPRDRGRHMLMTLARTEGGWWAIAIRFSANELADLRQRVIERFLAECPEGSALTTFAENVVKMCLGRIGSENGTMPTRLDVTMMHWVFMCLERIGDSPRLRACAKAFYERFVRLYSVCDKVDLWMRWTPTVGRDEEIIVVLSQPVIRQPQPIASMPSWTPGLTKPTVRREQEPVEPLMVWKPREITPIPVLGNGKETNAQIAARMGITKEQVMEMKKKGLLRG